MADDRDLMAQALRIKALAAAADALLHTGDSDNATALVAELHDRLPAFCSDLDRMLSGVRHG
jgi:hypothetical protein